MHYQAFIECLEEDECPGGLEHALQALWYDANGEAIHCQKFAWARLVKLDGDDLELQYRHPLENPGKQSGMLNAVFRKVQNRDDEFFLHD